MKVLSLKEPWATLIMLGYKKIETRSWNTKYRGPLYIHASQSTDTKILESKPFQKVLKNIPLNNGKIIAKVELVDTVEMTDELISKIKTQDDEYYFGIYEVGRFAWIFNNIQKVSPIEAKGKLGLWEFDTNLNQ